MPFEIAIFSHEGTYPNETDHVVELLDAGLDRFHVRKPDASISELKVYLSSIPEKYRSRIYVHYHRELAKQFDCKLHLQFKFASIQGEVQPCDSVSVHSLTEFEQIDGKIESCTLSPIFESISKENYAANPELYRIPKERSTRVIALGGIDQNTIVNAKELNFNGAAALGAIWHIGNSPLENFKSIQKAIQEKAEVC